MSCWTMRVRKMKGERRKKTGWGCPIYKNNSNKACKEERTSESILDQQTDDGN